MRSQIYDDLTLRQTVGPLHLEKRDEIGNKFSFSSIDGTWQTKTRRFVLLNCSTTLFNATVQLKLDELE